MMPAQIRETRDMGLIEQVVLSHRQIEMEMVSLIMMTPAQMKETRAMDWKEMAVQSRGLDR